MHFHLTFVVGALIGRAIAVPAVSEAEQVTKPQVRQTEKIKKYAVNGTGLPDVDFDIGESYAGLMPIYPDQKGSGELFFWYFPTDNEDGQDDITIWINGGPGCSSLEGFFQELGPVLWQYGTFKPVKNPWTWLKLTNMIWIEQPAGTGFSTKGNTKVADNEEEVATQFLSFFKNFLNTFDLKNKKIYIAGESYAGYYVPYIASAMLDQKDTTYFNLRASMIYDPDTSYAAVQKEIPVVPFVKRWEGLFNLNQSYMHHIETQHRECGYEEFWAKHMSFPPKGVMPHSPLYTKKGCDLWSDVLDAVSLTNPCFDVYQIATTCPILWDVLGFPGTFPYFPEGAQVYFNRTDVQEAINAPVGRWAECVRGVLRRDTSLPSSLSVLPGVIERSERTIIGHGSLDYILMANGTLLSIQNMTWGGKQGFQQEPADEFFVPYHRRGKTSTLSASGIMGVTHTERKLTWVETSLSGHMTPQYQPSASLRHLEFLLGRVSSLSERSGFTFEKDVIGKKLDDVVADAPGKLDSSSLSRRDRARAARYQGLRGM